METNTTLPALNGVADFLNKYFPYELINTYRRNYKKNNELIDIKILISEFKGLMFKMFDEEKYFISKLMEERTFYKVDIEYYDARVIEIVENFCTYVQNAFNWHPDFEQYKNRVNINIFFDQWFKEFRPETRINNKPVGSMGKGKPLNYETIQTGFSQEKLKKLYSELIKGKFIKSTTKENDFIYFFSGKPLNGIPKIVWKKSKKMCYYLIEKICPYFKLEMVNNCIQTKFKPFDSNDKSQNGYKSIDDILKLCD